MPEQHNTPPIETEDMEPLENEFDVQSEVQSEVQPPVEADDSPVVASPVRFNVLKKIGVAAALVGTLAVTGCTNERPAEPPTGEQEMSTELELNQDAAAAFKIVGTLLNTEAVGGKAVYAEADGSHPKQVDNYGESEGPRSDGVDLKIVQDATDPTSITFQAITAEKDGIAVQVYSDDAAIKREGLTLQNIANGFSATTADKPDISVVNVTAFTGDGSTHTLVDASGGLALNEQGGPLTGDEASAVSRQMLQTLDKVADEAGVQDQLHEQAPDAIATLQR